MTAAEVPTCVLEEARWLSWRAFGARILVVLDEYGQWLTAGDLPEMRVEFAGCIHAEIGGAS